MFYKPSHLPVPLIIIGLLISLLCFFWFIDHTTAIRYSAALSAFIILVIFNLRTQLNISFMPHLKPIIIILGLITAWLFLQTYFFALKPYEALDAIRGEWLKALLMGLLAFLVIRYTFATKKQSSIAINLVIFSLFFVIIIYYIDLLLGLATHKIEAPFGKIGYPFNHEWSEEGRESLSTMIILLLCLIIGEITYRVNTSKKYLNIHPLFLFTILVLSILAIFLLKTRLSQINLIILIVLAFFLIKKEVKPSSLFSKSKNLYLKVFTILVILFTLGYYAIKQDERWHTLLETSIYIITQSNDKLWLKEYFDQASPEQQAFVMNNHSNYMRLSLIREGVKAIAHVPQGVGYGKQAFKKAIYMTQHATPLLGSSHNGLIEFALGAGVIGLILLLLWFVVLIRFAKKHASHPAAHMLFLLTAMYFLQNLFDQRLMDHYIEFFVFSTFLLMSAVVTEVTNVNSVLK